MKSNDKSDALQDCTWLYRSSFYKLFGIELPVLTEDRLSDLMTRLFLNERQFDLKKEDDISSIYPMLHDVIRVWARGIRLETKSSDYAADEVKSIYEERSDSFSKLKGFLEYFGNKQMVKDAVRTHTSGVYADDILA